MMFFNSDNLDENVSKTERLDYESQKIIKVLKEGNSWKIGNGLGASASFLGLCFVGGGMVSPFVGLLLLTSLLSSVTSYFSYCLDEAQELGINPLLLPLIGGEESSTLSELLTDAEKSHWDLIELFGVPKVKQLESAGLLDSLVEAVQDIDLSNVDDDDRIKIYKQELKEIKNSVTLFPKSPSLGNSDRPSPSRNLPSSSPTVDPWDSDGISDRLSLPSTTAVDTLPPIKDVASDINSLDGHALIVAKTRSGKTTLLTEIMGQASGQVFLIDAKGDPRLSSASVYRVANTPPLAIASLREIANLMATLTTRQNLAQKGHTNFTPILLIVDEYNLLRLALKRDQGDLEYLTDSILRLLTQGASVGIKVILTSHSSRLNTLGFDGSIKDCLSFISLGRNRSYESLEDCLEYQISGRKSRKFQDELDELIHAEFPETLVFSTIAPMGFYRLPWVEQGVSAFTPTPEPDIRSSLDRLYDSATAAEPTINQPTPIEDKPASSKIASLDDETLDGLLVKVLAFAKRKERVKPSDISSGIRSMREYKSSDIMQLFYFLEGEGSGTVRGSEFIPD